MNAPATNPPRTSNRRMLEALTGLRFFAAMHVVLFHFFRPWLAEVNAPLWMRNIVGCGYIGVDLFFILSGFILTYSYLQDDGRMRTSSRSFWVARFARIYPLYAFALLVAMPFYFSSLLDQGVSLQHVAAKLGGAVLVLLMIQGFSPITASFWNGPAWSLSVEAFFYVIFPLLVPLVSRVRRNTAPLAIAGLWGICLLAPVLYTFFMYDGPELLTVASTTYWVKMIKFHPLLHMGEFLIGAVVGKLFLDDIRNDWQLGRRDRALMAWLSGGAFLISLTVMAISPAVPYLLLHNGLLAPVFATMIYALAHQQGSIARLFSLPAFVLLGDASYGVYILQVPLWNWFLLAACSITGLTRAQLDLSLPYLLAYAACLIGLSIAALGYLEKPLRVKIRNLAKPV